MDNNMSLKGKTIAITGSSRGIGKAIAALIEESGGNVALGSRSNTYDTNQNVLKLPLDVTSEESVKDFYEQAIQHFGNVDILINAAGVGVFSSVIDSSTEDFDHMINVNLRGSYLTCKLFGRYMAEKQSGHILNLVSVAGTTALPGNGGYSASKFGLMGLTKVLQAELRGKGVQVTAVIPGSVKSSFWDNIEPKPNMDDMIPVESLAKHLLFLINQPAGAFVDEITIMPPRGIL
jgi:3-oxoacyl-[acyl-carrier protein] reductase